MTVREILLKFYRERAKKGKLDLATSIPESGAGLGVKGRREA